MNRKAFLSISGLCLAGAGIWLLTRRPPEAPVFFDDVGVSKEEIEEAASRYDWTTATTNLAQIGVALQRYRKNQKVLPVSARRKPTDAGLPKNSQAMIESLALPPSTWFAPGHDLSGSLRKAGQKVGSNYQFVYVLWRAPDKDNSWIDRVWSERGESLPILVDWNPCGPDLFLKSMGSKTMFPCLVLRLDGTVSKLMANPNDLKTLMMKM